MKAAIFGALRQALAERRAVVLLTTLETGAQELVDLTGDGGGAAGGGLEPEVRAAVERAALTDECATLERAGGTLFVQPFNPPLRLVVVGAVHITQPLALMAAAAGFAVTIVDPRAAFATEERFPGVELVRTWPDEALRALRPDRRTAVVTLTHDPKLDDPALDMALGSPAFYIGCLGSQKTHAARLGRLGRRGHDEAALGRIHGPVGLRIGARSPAEIAVSILAQIIEQLRRTDA